MRRLLILAVVVTLGYVIARQRRTPPALEPVERLGPRLAAWVEPVNGACPPTHPVKAKLSSGIFHVPGGAMYARTNPDRCYLDAATAQADGLRPAKR